MNSPKRILALLSTGHGGNDLVAGWLLASYWTLASASESLAAFATYSVIAFGGQGLVALWIERTREPRRTFTLSIALLCVALAIARAEPFTAIVLSALASALVHVAGGVLSLQQPRAERSFGWFCAPGILGVTLGGWLGHKLGAPSAWLALAAAPLLILCRGIPREPRSEPDRTIRTQAATFSPFRSREGFVLLILLALVLRSAVWDVVQSMRGGEPEALFAIAGSAALGKLLGGIFIERWRSVRVLAIVLVIACALLDLGGRGLLTSCAGVMLLQSTIPAAVVLLNRSFGISAPRAVAWGLGITVAIGGLVSFAGVPTLVMRALPLLALVLMWRDGFRTLPRGARSSRTFVET